ncbi:MAG: DUF4399 domain-containing protein [Candidatus Nitrohelix vancouverensis]|uniref:DUF4399 domain-containing protein n=1 Tax=Candidatus Nitrohelix vancouverensis TaxID=2705534 RepID=A0A7T0C523_9BACT|nr:MAG: DUF4399 domain-containing protein [Candidatus Nitrohelix vancouverensis]
MVAATMLVGCTTGGMHASSSHSANSGQVLTITTPATTADVTNPVEVCMAINGYTVEPAKNGVNPGKGHHHLLIDVDVPKDLSQPLAKDSEHVHMGDGSTCKSLTLSKGQHVITAVFAQGNHVPYNPPITAAVIVHVK